MYCDYNGPSDLDICSTITFEIFSNALTFWRCEFDKISLYICASFNDMAICVIFAGNKKMFSLFKVHNYQEMGYILCIRQAKGYFANKY